MARLRTIETRPQKPERLMTPPDAICGKPRMTHQQVADLLGCTRQNVADVFYRINKRLRAVLADLDPYKREAA